MSVTVTIRNTGQVGLDDLDFLPENGKARREVASLRKRVRDFEIAAYYAMGEEPYTVEEAAERFIEMYGGEPPEDN